MDEKKKIKLISVTAAIILIIIGGIVLYFVVNNNASDGSKSKTKNSEVSNLYETLHGANVFSFELELDDESHMYYAKSNDTAYIDTANSGREIKYLIESGNTYLLVDDTKTYYTYSNNVTNLNMVTRGLEKVKDLEYQTGREKLDNKNYSYEEYTGVTDFAMGDFTEDSESVKTRFYFDGDELVYIKTIENDKEELLKVNISYDANQNLFQIPQGYSEA